LKHNLCLFIKKTQAQESLPEKHQSVQQKLIEIYGYNLGTDDDIFVDDMTWGAYFAMSDKAQVIIQLLNRSNNCPEKHYNRPLIS